jgi:hypothetical protein
MFSIGDLVNFEPKTSQLTLEGSVVPFNTKHIGIIIDKFEYQDLFSKEKTSFYKILINGIEEVYHENFLIDLKK